MLVSVYSWLKFIVVLVDTLDNFLNQILLERLESCWLGRWKGVLLGQSISEDHQKATVTASRRLQRKITNLFGFSRDVERLEVMRTIWSFL